MKVDQALVNAAIDLAEHRYSGDLDGDGWAGAAAMYCVGWSDSDERVRRLTQRCSVVVLRNWRNRRSA